MVGRPSWVVRRRCIPGGRCGLRRPETSGMVCATVCRPSPRRAAARRSSRSSTSRRSVASSPLISVAPASRCACARVRARSGGRTRRTTSSRAWCRRPPRRRRSSSRRRQPGRLPPRRGPHRDRSAAGPAGRHRARHEVDRASGAAPRRRPAASGVEVATDAVRDCRALEGARGCARTARRRSRRGRRRPARQPGWPPRCRARTPRRGRVGASSGTPTSRDLPWAGGLTGTTTANCCRIIATILSAAESSSAGGVSGRDNRGARPSSLHSTTGSPRAETATRTRVSIRKLQQKRGWPFVVGAPIVKPAAPGDHAHLDRRREGAGDRRLHRGPQPPVPRRPPDGRALRLRPRSAAALPREVGAVQEPGPRQLPHRGRSDPGRAADPHRRRGVRRCGRRCERRRVRRGLPRGHASPATPTCGR